MKTDDMPFGNIFKRYLIALLVFIGFSGNAFAAIPITSDMIVGNSFYDSYTEQDGSYGYDKIIIDTNSTGVVHELWYDATDTLQEDITVAFMYQINSSGQIVIDDVEERMTLTLEEANSSLVFTEEIDFNYDGSTDETFTSEWFFDKPAEYPALIDDAIDITAVMTCAGNMQALDNMTGTCIDLNDTYVDENTTYVDENTTYVDENTTYVDENTTGGTLPTGDTLPADIMLFKTVLTSDGNIIDSYFNGTSFVSDGNSTFTVDSSNVMTMTWDDGNETAKLDSVTDVNGLTAYSICSYESGFDGGYWKFTLLAGDEASIFALKDDPTFDITAFDVEITETEYAACNALDVTQMYDQDLYSIELDDGMGGEDPMSYPFQVVGTVGLPALGTDSYVWMEAMPLAGYEWGYAEIGNSEGNNTYSLGINSGKYVLKLGVSTMSSYNDYVYDANTSTWMLGQTVEGIAVDELGNIVPPEEQDPTAYYNFVPNVTPIDTADFNTDSQMEVNMDLAALYADQYTISGSVTVSGDFEPGDYCTDMSMNTADLQICEWNPNGVPGYNNWYGANRINIEIADAQTGEFIGWYGVEGLADVNTTDNTKTYQFSAPVISEGNYTIRVNKDTFDTTTLQTSWEGYFFNPETSTLIDSMNVMDIETTDGMWVPDTAVTGVLEVAEVDGSREAAFGNIDFAGLAATQIKLNGTLTFDSADADFVQIELINAQNGQYFGWKELQTSGDFNITLPAGEGEYIIRLSKASQYNWESYYYDVANAKFVSDINVNWVDTATGQSVLDVNQTGSVLISDQNSDGSVTQDEIPTLAIDFTALDSQFYTLEGNVTVPADFVAGDITDDSGMYIGWNNITFEVIEKSTGNWIGWYEIDRDSNVTTTSGKNYSYKIKLANAGDYNVRVRYENQSENRYEGYFVDFNSSALVNEMKVPYIETTDSMGYIMWIPDFANSLVLDDTNKNQSLNIDFVALADSMYKLTGSITVPTGFVPEDDWENRKMIRVEAIDANTGMWLGDGPISNTANTDGTYNYTLNLPDVNAGMNIVVRLIKEEQSAIDWSWEAYYVNFGTDHNVSGGDTTLVAEETVQWVESNTTDSMGYPMWTPDLTQTGYLTLDDTKNIVLDIDYNAMLAEYEANKLSFSGTVVLSQAVNLGYSGNYWNSIRLEAMDANNGEWVASTEVDYTNETSDEFTFDFEFAQSGDYIIRVMLELDGTWEEYYINFGEDHAANGTLEIDLDKLVPGSRVDWTEAAVQANWGGYNWMPNPAQTGFINLDAKVEAYEINFGTFESSIAKISGSITVEADFETGDVYDASGNWVGYNNIRVEAISKSTGDWIASTNLVNKNELTDSYSYELKLGDLAEVGSDFIVKVVKESSTNNNWEFDELFINFGANHAFDADDSLVNGKRVQWIESDTLNEWGYTNWLPNPEETGWITVVTGTNPENVNVDFTTLGQNDITITGAVTFKAGFDLSTEADEARVSLIDAATGMWVADTSVNEDGSYTLNLGDASYAAGSYILQVSYGHNDFTNWENSWWKMKYVDFGADNVVSGDDTVLNDNEIQWQEIAVEGQEWGMWIPMVNPIEVTSSIAALDIDVSVVSGGTITGSITGIPAGANYPYAFVVNPTTNGNSWLELREQTDGSYTFSAEEVAAGSYTVEFGYDIDGKYYHFFIKDSDTDLTNGVGTVEGQEVSWTDLGNGVWGPSANDTTYVSIANQATTNLDITLTVVTYNQVVVTLDGTEDNKYASADIHVPSKSFGRWEENTTVGTSVDFTFDDVKDGTGYILNFWYDNNSYTCDGASCGTLVKNAMWLAFDETDNQVCPLAGNDWNCDWDNSYNWSWRPDVTPVTVSGNTNITATLPQELTVSGALSLGTDFAGDNVYVSIFQHNGNDWNWADFTLDSNGEVNSSMRVDGGNDYRIELWVDGLGGYVYTPTGWITQNNSWEENNVTHMWEPKTDTLVDINANLDLGLIEIGANLSKVTIVLENLDTDSNGNVIEDVWVSFESTTEGWYGEGNANWESYPVTYDSNITMKLPASNDYRIMVFPMNHKGGYGSNGNGNSDDGITQVTELNWNEQDYVAVSGDTTLTVTLPAANEVGTISGTVVCDENNASADCSGWIDAWSGMDGKGAMVNSNGTFEIKGLEAGTYEVNYWANSGMSLQQSDVSVVANSVTDITITKDLTNMFSSITGTVTAADLTDVFVVLIETDGTSFEVINGVEVDGNGDYSFEAMPKTPAGKALVIAVAKRTYDSSYASTVVFDEEVELYDADGAVGLPALNNEDFATGLTAVANEY